MKNLFICFLFISTFAQAQHVLSERLQNAIRQAEHMDEQFSIRIEMLDKVDAFELHKTYISQQTPLKKRAVNTIQLLQEKARNSQAELLAFIEDYHPESYANLRSYWIINQVYLEADQNLIYQLGIRSDLAFIDLNIDKTSPLNPIEQSTQAKSSTGEIETGIEAINATALWDLGYTGKGLLVYDYDTGVWPEHPAFSNRFLANRFPEEQSWFGYFRNFPNGIISNHGTHTLGTMIGEGLPSGDTVGIAPAAYWMACDLVTSTVEELPPLENIVQAYQWALDADNNPASTDDIPDVINNSWRWHDNPDTIHCNDYIRDLMNVIEAVGIANVFSGGNAGPDNTTISAPQRINTTIVNTFSVGSINANLDGNPISYFSSRGPLQCPATDSSLTIHPEVVAPGHDVRSAWGVNTYNTISGTSMAAPHVSGAVLLLKEAFPMLSGADILTALYYTATDMGVSGEDNTFGMGLIDCLAAYNYLSQNNTPVNPNAPSNDLEILNILAPAPITNCNTTISPNFTVRNNGVETIDSLFISVRLNANLIENTTWTGTLAAGSSTTIQLSELSIEESSEIENELQIHVTVPNWNEVDVFNNSMVQRFSWHPTSNAPFIETFESNNFTENLWRITNADEDKTWEIDAFEGLENSNFSAKVNLFIYSYIGHKDYLTSPSININSNEEYYLHFDYAHQHRNSGGRADSLIVEVSTDCGASYQTIFQKGGDLLTTSDTLDMNFVPLYDTHWGTATIELNDYVNNASQIMLRFSSYNGKQNNLYLDNISVATLEEFSTIEQEASTFMLFPNPAEDKINITWNANETQELSIQLIDLRGRTIVSKKYNSKKQLKLNWDVSQLEPGSYFFKLNTAKGSSVKRFIKR